VKHNELNIGRDRNNIDEAGLMKILCGVLSWFRVSDCSHQRTRNLADTCENCKVVYLFLRLFEQLKSTDQQMFFEKHPPPTPMCAQIANNLLWAFFFLHSAKSIPATAAEVATRQSDANLLGYKLVECTNSLVKYLQFSPDCPTLDKIMQANSEQYLALPELLIERNEFIPYPVNKIDEFIDPVSKAIASKIRSFSALVFEHLLRAEQIRFKDFRGIPEHSQPVIKIFHLDKYYFVVDCRQFTADAVHAKNLEEDPKFTCSGIKCGCILDRLIECLWPLLQHIHKLDANAKRIFEKKIRRICLGEVLNVACPASNTARAVPVEKPRQVKNVRMTTSQPALPVHFSPERTTAIAKKDSINCIYATRTKSIPNIMQRVEISFPQPVPDAPDPRLALCFPESSAVEYYATVGRLPYVTLKSPPVSDLRLLEPFSVLIASIADIFQVSLRNEFGVGLVNIYWEESVVFGFNCKELLYFNAYHFSQNLLPGSDEYLAHCSFWYLTFCHELAHNLELQHGARHTHLMTKIAEEYMPKFVSKFHQ
jgi:hypothetical protein